MTVSNSESCQATDDMEYSEKSVKVLFTHGSSQEESSINKSQISAITEQLGFFVISMSLKEIFLCVFFELVKNEKIEVKWRKIREVMIKRTLIEILVEMSTNSTMKKENEHWKSMTRTVHDSNQLRD